jgi:hypothetical protein
VVPVAPKAVEGSVADEGIHAQKSF